MADSAGRSREALPDHAWVSAFQRTASKQTGDDSVSVLDDKDELRSPTVNGGFGSWLWEKVRPIGCDFEVLGFGGVVEWVLRRAVRDTE